MEKVAAYGVPKDAESIVLGSRLSEIMCKQVFLVGERLQAHAVYGRGAPAKVPGCRIQ